MVIKLYSPMMDGEMDGEMANLRVGYFCVPVFFARSLTCLIGRNGIMFFFFPQCGLAL